MMEYKIPIYDILGIQKNPIVKEMHKKEVVYFSAIVIKYNRKKKRE